MLQDFCLLFSAKYKFSSKKKPGYFYFEKAASEFVLDSLIS